MPAPRLLSFPWVPQEHDLPLWFDCPRSEHQPGTPLSYYSTASAAPFAVVAEVPLDLSSCERIGVEETGAPVGADPRCTAGSSCADFVAAAKPEIVGETVALVATVARPDSKVPDAEETPSSPLGLHSHPFHETGKHRIDLLCCLQRGSRKTCGLLDHTTHMTVLAMYQKIVAAIADPVLDPGSRLLFDSVVRKVGHAP